MSFEYTAGGIETEQNIEFHLLIVVCDMGIQPNMTTEDKTTASLGIDGINVEFALKKMKRRSIWLIKIN